MKEQEKQQPAAFDPLDMNNYKIEKLPKMEKSTFEKWMARWGGPLAILAFILIYWVVDIPFINNLDPSKLDKKAKARYAQNVQPASHHFDGGSNRREGAYYGRQRNGQRVGGKANTSSEPPFGGTLCGGQLCSHTLGTD